jgi:hypothetical protein
MPLEIPQPLERWNQKRKVVQGRGKLVGPTTRLTRQSLGSHLQAHLRQVLNTQT